MTSIIGANTSLAAETGNAALAKNSADFDMFLKLLTTQMQNQDPLDPMETAEYTQQLVQFSQVEQTIQQTTTLKDILAGLSAQSMAQASGYLGREAQFSSDVAGLRGDAPAQWHYEAQRSVASMVVTVTNEAGQAVDTRVIDAASSGEFTWDGMLANGSRASDGPYSLTITGIDANGVEVPVAVSSIGRVDEVAMYDGALQLGVNGVQLPASALLRVS